MINFLILFALPVVIALALHFLFKKEIEWPEVIVQLVGSALIIVITLGIAYKSSMMDTEVWNGQITKKSTYHTSCSHSYKCNCYTTTDSKGNSTEHCSTCYEHDYDVNWDLYASTGETTRIDRIDSQGLISPPRWQSAYLGEPFSSTHTFDNYIRSNPDSVLLGTTGDIEKYKKFIPKYPDVVYDYYKHDPVINMIPNVDVGTWNWLIREDNKILGTTKQANVILILVPLDNRDYIYALKDAWLGGKKNDIDVVIGSKDGHTIDFVEIMSWSTNASFKVHLKNDIERIGSLDKRDDISAAIFNDSKNEFVRMHMKDMKYLMRSYQPSHKTMMIAFILSMIFSIACPIGWWASKNNF